VNDFQREALLWEKLDNKNVRCNVCHNRCIIPPGKVSRCLSRKNVDGQMMLQTYAKASSIAADPIEKKPLYHFHRGTTVFSVGGWGCNFNCKHCQNWNISQEMRDNKGYYLTPEKAVELAVNYQCDGICWTYNEPAIWLEYTVDSAKIAKKKGLYTAYVTNGFMKIEALDLLAPYLDAYRVDLKSFEDEFYREICGVKSCKGVFETAKHAKKLKLHIEAVTNIIPTKNDSVENLKNIAEWIAANLGKETPWHVTRFFPCYKLDYLPPTPVETLRKAEETGLNAGLKHIYLGNVRKHAYYKN